MDEKTLLESISTDEDHYMEFKSGFINNRHLSDYMMLFANADGGTIFLGIDEETLEPSGKIHEVTKDETDNINRAAIDGLTPPLDGVTYDTVSCPSYDNCKVIIIYVPNSPKLHQNRKGTIARRRGSEREPIYINRELTEIVSKADYDYDAHALTDYSIEDIDPNAIALYREKYLNLNPASGINDLHDEELLKRKRALIDKEGILTPTLTGILFFGVNVEEVMPFSRVDFVQYAGSEVGESENGEVYLDRKTIIGTIPQMISDCERLITDRIASKGYLKNGFDRKEVKEYPLFAYREAVINALCHRDYSLRGAAVQIRLFSDRLEIQSPGNLPGHVTTDNIVSECLARNLHIAILLKDMGYVEQLGIGIDMMIRTMVESGLEPPIFKEDESSFTVILKHHALLDEESLKWLKNYDDYDLSADQRKALAYTWKYGKIANKDYQIVNSVKREMATRDLSDMVSKGIIEQIGTKGGAYYELIDLSTQPPYRIEEIIPDDIWKSLNNTMKRIVKLFENNPKLTRKEVEEVIGIDRRNIQRYLAELCEKGVLNRIGKSESDPGIHYILNDDIADRKSQNRLF